MGERNNGKVTIALLGVTGAGKTTFVSVASGRDDLIIGHGVDPCKSTLVSRPTGNNHGQLTWQLQAHKTRR